MKKFVLTLLASVLIGTRVNAQEAKCGSCKKQDKAQHKTEMMAQKLGLDEAQKAKVLELNKNFELKLQSAVCEGKHAEKKDCCGKGEHKNEGSCKKDEKKQGGCCDKKDEQKKDSCCEKKVETEKKCSKENHAAGEGHCKKQQGQHHHKKMCPKKMKQLHEEYMKELQTILNAEQIAKLKENCKSCDHHKKEEQKCEK